MSDASGILGDVFRRADKNDDGDLSLDEFKAFFADDVVSEEELAALFSAIDSDNSEGISPPELTTYFSAEISAAIPGRGDAQQVDGSGTVTQAFDALRSFSGAYSEILGASATVDPASKEHFALRFLISEMKKQLVELAGPLGDAETAMVRAAISARPGKIPFQERSSSDSLLSNRRVMRKTSQAVASAGGSDESEELTSNLAKLASIVDRLSGKAKLVPQALQSWGDDEKSLILHKTLVTDDDTNVAQFSAEIEKYMNALRGASGCTFCNCKAGEDNLDLYEIWNSDDALADFNKSAASKAFGHACVDSLAAPVTTVQMATPGEWWA